MSDRPVIDQLAAAVAAHADGDGTHATAIPGLYLTRLSTTRVPRTTVDRPVLCVVAQGAKAILLGDARRVYDPSTYLLVGRELPLVGEVVRASARRPFLGASLTLDVAEVEAIASEIGAPTETTAPTAPTAQSSSRGPGVAVSPFGSDLLDAVLRLVRLLDTPARIPVLAPLVRREIAYLLLVGAQGDALRHMVAERGQARRIAAGIAWLTRHVAEPVRMADLAREVHMSPSTMHSWFKAVTTMSPLQFQKQLRLQEARRLMLADGDDVATASRRVGYESPSQFSRDYRRLFGAPPRRDVERLRAVRGALDAPG